MEDEEREERLRFACPPARGAHDGIELELLDAADRDQRSVLIRAEHPAMARAIERGRDEILVAGEPVNPRLHLIMHEVVAEQLIAGDPPEAWQTARRLTGLGYGRHEVLHMLAFAMSGQIWAALHEGTPYDPEAHRRALASLPEAWEEQRPPSRRERRDARRRRG